MIGPADPQATLVLRGNGNGGRTIYTVQLVLGCVYLLMIMAQTSLYLSLSMGGTSWMIAMPQIFLPILMFSQAAAHAQRVRELRPTELWMSPNGIAYACPAGVFGVPWQAVRRIGFGRKGTVLCVEASGWQGPVSKLGSYWKSTRTLEIDLDAEPAAVAARIQAATGIQIAPHPVSR